MFRIRTLLVAVALLPLAGLATFAVRDVLTRWQVTENVDLVVSDAELVGHLLVAKEAAASELDAVMAIAEAAAFGVDADFIRDVIGIDFVTSLTPARTRFDDSLARVEAAQAAGAAFAAPDPITELLGARERLTELRAALDAGAIEPSHVDEFIAVIRSPIEAATEAQLAAVARNAALLGENGAVDTAAAEARQAIVVADLIRAEGVALSQYVVPIRPPDNPDPDPALLDLLTTAEVARYEIARMEADFDAESLATWHIVRDDPVFAEYRLLRDAALAGEISPMAGDFDAVSRAANGATANGALTATFADEMNERVIEQAERVGAGARDELRRSAILAGLIGLATLLGTVLLSNSIVRPLRLLEARARRITDGDLRGAEAATGGPREIAVVDRALTELVAGLKVLETQAEALSVADLSAPALDRTSPGRLGESLKRSVERLSEMASRLEHEASHDQLTGLLNRMAGIGAIESALARARRSASDVAVLFVDLDGFKGVNDLHGHPTGDRVLLEAAVRIAETSREADTVARLGGDEFIVVLEQVEEIAAAVDVAQRIVEALQVPFRIGEVTAALSASVGIARAARGQATAPNLLVQADLALYRAKGQGKGRTAVFDEHLQRVVNRRAVVEVALERAIRDDRLDVWFQPVVTTADHSVWGMEALVRWRRTDGELILPDEFVPVAERSDLVLALDRYVLTNACEQLARWRHDPLARNLKLAVNVSGRHLDAGDLPGDIREVLAATGAPAEQLVVEMTETRLVRDLDAVSAAMRSIRDLGIGVAIDDFGTGYASVAHLRRLPATHLKIDRSFVSGSTNPTDRSILELLAWLGEALDLEVVAEGVENEEQLALIKSLGCTHVQGYLIGRPMPVADVVPWLTLHQPRVPSEHPGPPPG